MNVMTGNHLKKVQGSGKMRDEHSFHMIYVRLYSYGKPLVIVLSKNSKMDLNDLINILFV